MSDVSAVLALPYIQPSQAQKHVTHNEALRLLDVIVQLAVLDRSRTAPPGTAALGDRHIVAAGATGDWAGQDGAIAVFDLEGWVFPPQPGWRAEVLAESTSVVFHRHGLGGTGRSAAALCPAGGECARRCGEPAFRFFCRDAVHSCGWRASA